MEADNNPQLPNSLEATAAAIADRCASDPDWMEQFKADPRRTLESLAGRKLPDDLQIHLHQNDDDNWHVPVSDTASGQMHDSDLQRIAGGEVAITAVLVGAFSATAVAAGVAVGGSTAAGVIVSDKKKSAGKK